MAGKKPDYSMLSPELRKVMEQGDKERADPRYAERQRRAFSAGTVTGQKPAAPSPFQQAQQQALARSKAKANDQWNQAISTSRRKKR